MFKEIFKMESVSLLSHISLIIFVVVFLSLLVWTYARTRREIIHWSNLPLEDGEHVSPRTPQQEGR
jgi:cbb3-type cytochrome oxidase subunit 3